MLIFIYILKFQSQLSFLSLLKLNSNKFDTVCYDNKVIDPQSKITKSKLAHSYLVSKQS